MVSHPSSHATAPETLARGVLIESVPGRLVLGIPGTEYQLHLTPTGPISIPVGRRVSGTITLNARRIDLCTTGGNAIDPLMGPPRNIVGRVVAHDPASNVLIIHARVPMRVRVRPPQTSQAFPVGSLVTFAAEPGAAFAPSED